MTEEDSSHDSEIENEFERDALEPLFRAFWAGIDATNAYPGIAMLPEDEQTEAVAEAFSEWINYQAEEFEDYFKRRSATHAIQKSVELYVEHIHQEDGGETAKPETIDDISGVGSVREQQLREAGVESVSDIEKMSQHEIADIDGIGKALAARIKADVGDSDD